LTGSSQEDFSQFTGFRIYKFSSRNGRRLASSPYFRNVFISGSFFPFSIFVNIWHVRIAWPCVGGSCLWPLCG